MKRIIFINIFLFIACINTFSQDNLSIAKTKYKEFSELKYSEDKEKRFNVLYECYKVSYEVLMTLNKDSEEYAEVKQNMLNLWRHLEYGIAFFQKSDQQISLYLAEAYIKMPQLEDFKNESSKLSYSNNYPKIVYLAASRYLKAEEYAKAIPYLKEYLKIRNTEDRYSVYSCLAEAYIKENNKRQALNTLKNAIAEFPNDYNLNSRAVNICLEIHDYRNIQIFLDNLKRENPYNKNVCSIQALVYEEFHDFENALKLYRDMQKDAPNNLEIIKHIALNLFNLGVINNNKAMTETEKNAKKKQMKQSVNYFNEALPVLQEVVKAEPTSVMYNKALAVVYSCLNKTEKFDDANKLLASMGVGTIDADYVPESISFSDDIHKYANDSYREDIAAELNPNDVPKFSVFAKPKFENNLKQWMQKDPYETIDEFNKRVTEENRIAKIKELQKGLESEYIRKYCGLFTVDSLKLIKYDSENEVFLMDSWLGYALIKVPRDHNEAKFFHRDWNRMTLDDPKFYVVNDFLALESATFITPSGMKYHYSKDDDLSFTDINVSANFDPVDISGLTIIDDKLHINIEDLIIGGSDVDVEIPEGGTSNENTFALIIANEDYKTAGKVPFALNDGTTFKNYCQKTLGISENNISFVKNATANDMRYNINLLLKKIDLCKGEGKAIIYYSGHGVPDEATRSAYLMPTDSYNMGDGDEGYSLNKLYKEFGEVPSQGIIFFMDACFTGIGRDGNSLSEGARGSGIKSKKEDTNGRVVVLNATNGAQTAWPYREKKHGLFTYHLLKKLKETKGEATLGEIAEYVRDNVEHVCLYEISKSQTPTVTVPELLGDEWKLWNLK